MLHNYGGENFYKSFFNFFFYRNSWEISSDIFQKKMDKNSPKKLNFTWYSPVRFYQVIPLFQLSHDQLTINNNFIHFKKNRCCIEFKNKKINLEDIISYNVGFTPFCSIMSVIQMIISFFLAFIMAFFCHLIPTLFIGITTSLTTAHASLGIVWVIFWILNYILLINHIYLYLIFSWTSKFTIRT